MPEVIQSNLRYALIAVNQNPEALQVIGEDLRQDSRLTTLAELCDLKERAEEFQRQLRLLRVKGAHKIGMFSSSHEPESSPDSDGIRLST